MLVLTLALVVVFATAAYEGLTLAPNNTVTLPVEVLGQSGHIESVTVDVSDPSSVERLYVEGHNLGYHKSDYAESNGYDGKASFRINGGAWVPIDNQTFSAFAPEKNYYSGQLSGPIGGPWKVLRGTLPVNGTGALQSGANTIEFRFNRTEGMSSGYRILDLDLHRSDGSSGIGSTSFVESDPDTWSAPYTSSSAIDEGKTYWNARNSLVEGPNGQSIVASCADCHAQDGRDLKYFNFSNKSIITRAEFHGLSTEKGRKIASYIRTRNLDLPSGYTVADAGRPWNPPYQPGPGLKDLPAELWAAGAGMKWVLKDDMQMYPLLFPSDSDEQTLDNLSSVPQDPDAFLSSLSGTQDPEAMLPRTSVDSSLNVDELPVAMPLPDIFEWWPDVHPIDFLPGGTSGFENGNVAENYETWRTEMEKGRSHIESLVQESSNSVGSTSTSYKSEGIVGLAMNFSRPWYDVDWTWPDGWNTEVSDEKLRQKLSFEQWRAIKTWEIMHEFDLEDYGDEIFAENPDGVRAGGSDRTWWIEISLYDVAPHKNGKPGYPSDGAYATECQNLYFSSSWYEISSILNTGNRLGKGNSPYDWNYHHPHIGDHVKCYGTNQALRYVKAQILAQQQRGADPTFFEDGKGWVDWHVHMPERIAAAGGKAVHMRSLPSELRFDIAEAVTRAHMNETAEYSPSIYKRGSGEALKTSSYTPQVANEIGLGYPNHPDAYITMTKMYAENGVSPYLVDDMARWGEQMWPGANWEQWMLDHVDQNIPVRSGWNLISTRLVPNDKDVEKIFSSIKDDVSIVKNEGGQVYSPVLGINEIGDWEIDEGYMVYSKTSQTLRIVGPESDTERSLSLEAGWSLLPFIRNSEMDVVEAFSSIESEIVVVKDSDGNTYVPEFNVNDIGTLKPGQSYKIYLESPVTFSYPTTSKSTQGAPATSANRP